LSLNTLDHELEVDISLVEPVKFLAGAIRFYIPE
jgi:hypothetical protein